MPANDMAVFSPGQPESADLAISPPDASGVSSSAVPVDELASRSYSEDPGTSDPPTEPPHVAVIADPVASPVEDFDFAQQAIAGRDLVGDIAACANFDPGKAYFPLMKEKALDILCVAYPASIAPHRGQLEIIT